MLDFVAGKLVSKKPTEAVVDVAGLGYRLLISTSAYERMPSPGEPVKMLCHLHVREDAMLLFGFSDEAERYVFNLLIGVSGVGPKLALAALSAMSPAELGNYITAGDAAMLTRIPGVGRKTAERLVVDLRDRFDAADVGEAEEGASPGPTGGKKDALSALEALGLSRKAAEKSLRDVLQKHPGVESAEELIRLALRG
jgi:Holliday junction DNA helicase RuvA